MIYLQLIVSTENHMIGPPGIAGQKGETGYLGPQGQKGTYHIPI